MGKVVDAAIGTKRASISNSVSETLRGRIISGEFGPGDKIPPEVELCKMYGVSRVTVRSAIQHLKGAGLLESKQGGGTFVRTIRSVDAIDGIASMIAREQPNRIDVFEFRRIMEVESVGLAAVRANSEMVKRMDETVERMNRATMPEEMARWDLEFHRLVALATDNSYIIKVFDVLKDSYYTVLCQNTRIMGSNGARFHALICRAIEIRDVDMAKTYMKEHLTDTIKHTLTQMRAAVVGEKGTE